MYQNNQQVININIDDILPNRFQPRLKFNEEEISSLSESIREHGVIQPIVVRKLGDRYELIAGERRTKASKMAGMTTIPAIIVNLNDNESAEVALIENIQRQDLTSIEEAVSYRKILDMGYLNQSQLAEKVGKKQSTIANKLRLLTLPKKVQSSLLESKISERHARSLLRLENEEKQIDMLERIISERLTVRKTDQEIDKIINLSKVEVLEIPNLEDFEMKEDDKMNNNFNFNDIEIPTTSIIDENNNNMADINEVAEPLNVQENISNPGFMDIDKIADQAQDIKGNDMLFNVSPEQIIPTIPEEKPTEEIRPTKFFNILENETSFEQETPIIENKPETSSNNMDIFNMQPSPVSTQETQMSISSQGEENIEKSINVEEQINTEEPINIEEPVSVEEEISIEDPQIEVPINNDIKEVSEVAPGVSNIGSEAIFQQNPNTADLEIDDIAIIDDNTFGTEDSIATLTQDEPEVIKPPLRDVISKARELSNTIESMNYAVELEEMDLEEIYQIIIKIHK